MIAIVITAASSTSNANARPAHTAAGLARPR